ncbi:unnamed protein product, partial [Discosporangium mesarthrocarpum]
SYDRLLSTLAGLCMGLTGAELAGLVRSAASYALERSVSGVGADIGAGGGAGAGAGISGVSECVVGPEDLSRGLADV